VLPTSEELCNLLAGLTDQEIINLLLWLVLLLLAGIRQGTRLDQNDILEIRRQVFHDLRE